MSRFPAAAQLVALAAQERREADAKRKAEEDVKARIERERLEAERQQFPSLRSRLMSRGRPTASRTISGASQSKFTLPAAFMSLKRQRKSVAMSKTSLAGDPAANNRSQYLTGRTRTTLDSVGMGPASVTHASEALGSDLMSSSNFVTGGANTPNQQQSESSLPQLLNDSVAGGGRQLATSIAAMTGFGHGHESAGCHDHA
ncbi:hypothetical protein BCR44DRAFT_33955 [Catenaria anguillulae PL171]|uniref:Uncharacterized protein n=1 Tax=Catenaria anguillulae PL171 TaxID=765915 RepID=A0A1Y2HFN8_9FUNG|nr:hypothetical protein BCR44DRAFT_33955 [Catenaria anguillulae PL171]